MTSDLPALIAKRFIQRRDVKAVQFSNGAWSPDRELKDKSRHGLGFKKKHLDAHLSGEATYGHYLIDGDNRARVFALDIDLEKAGTWIENGPEAQPILHECNPREIWGDRAALGAREWYKYQMKMLATMFAKVITADMELPCAAAYSGSKGIHIYGFLGDSPALAAHEGALLAIDLIDQFEPLRGKVFFKHRNQDPVTGYPSFSVEAFPKQPSLDGKDLGNLMRLPLGKNLKSKDPTFFIDLTSPMGVMSPHPDPIRLLESGNPFE